MRRIAMKRIIAGEVCEAMSVVPLQSNAGEVQKKTPCLTSPSGGFSMHASRRFWSVAVGFAVVLGAGSIGPLRRATVLAGEEKDEDEKARVEDDAMAKQRLALMHDRVAAFCVKSKEEGLPQRFETRPIF